MADQNTSLPIRSQADGADERVHVKIVDGTTPTQRATVSAAGNVGVLASGKDGGGTERVLLVDGTGQLKVVLSEGSAGSDVNDFKDAAAIAASASDNHDYTVTAAKTLSLKQVIASASGKMKMNVQVETGVATGVFNSKFVGFNSTANPNINVMLSEPILVAAGVRVRVVMTNLDNQAQDLYSTINGEEN